MSTPPGLDELEALYSALTPAERDELLQCLFVAAPRGGEAMIKVLQDFLLCHAAGELLKEHVDEPLAFGGSPAAPKG